MEYLKIFSRDDIRIIFLYSRLRSSMFFTTRATPNPKACSLAIRHVPGGNPVLSAPAPLGALQALAFVVNVEGLEARFTSTPKAPGPSEWDPKP